MDFKFEPITKVYQDEHILMLIDSVRYFNQAIEATGSTVAPAGICLCFWTYKIQNKQIYSQGIDRYNESARLFHSVCPL